MPSRNGLCSFPHGGEVLGALIIALTGALATTLYAITSCRFVVLVYYSNLGDLDGHFTNRIPEDYNVKYVQSLGLFTWLRRPFDALGDNWGVGECAGYSMAQKSSDELFDTYFEIVRIFGILSVLGGFFILLWSFSLSCISINKFQKWMYVFSLLAVTAATSCTYLVYLANVCQIFGTTNESKCTMDQGGLVGIAAIILWLLCFLIAAFWIDTSEKVFVQDDRLRARIDERRKKNMQRRKQRREEEGERYQQKHNSEIHISYDHDREHRSTPKSSQSNSFNREAENRKHGSYKQIENIEKGEIKQPSSLEHSNSPASSSLRKLTHDNNTIHQHGALTRTAGTLAHAHVAINEGSGGKRNSKPDLLPTYASKESLTVKDYVRGIAKDVNVVEKDGHKRGNMIDNKNFDHHNSDIDNNKIEVLHPSNTVSSNASNTASSNRDISRSLSTISTNVVPVSKAISLSEKQKKKTTQRFMPDGRPVPPGILRKKRINEEGFEVFLMEI